MISAAERVTVVTVTYQSVALVEDLVRVLSQFPRTIVIDNASSDGTAEALTHRLPQAQVLRMHANCGFGPANNAGVARAVTPYVLLLNPDCDIGTAALEQLVATADAYPSAAIIAPQGWHAENRPQVSYRQAFYEPRCAQPYRIPDGTCSAKWLHGCCMLVRVEAFRCFGGFDERFFLYYEDDDLCLRAIEAGFECLLEPKADVLHPGGKSSAPSWRTHFRKNFYFVQSRQLILRKYVGSGAARRYRWRTAFAAPFAALLYTVLLQRRQVIKWLAWGCSAWKGEPKHHA
jgi:N-acetylglucosaminyl-diphospho-decaprenol L-rhamnosyltransferase